MVNKSKIWEPPRFIRAEADFLYNFSGGEHMTNATELKARLEFWRSALTKLREAYLALLDGGVKSYKIDNKELKRLDLVSLQKRIDEAEKKVDELEALVEGGKGRKAYAVVPMDW